MKLSEKMRFEIAMASFYWQEVAALEANLEAMDEAVRYADLYARGEKNAYLTVLQQLTARALASIDALQEVEHSPPKSAD